MKVFAGCVPSRKLHWEDEELEEFTLPENYRPPSRHGWRIPVTDNMYHAYPEKPKYNDLFHLSKNSGTYKQCLGKKSRQECACAEHDEEEVDIKHSDCMKHVKRIFFDEHYAPKFTVSQYGSPDLPLSQKFRLIELNGRTDYCFACIYILSIVSLLIW